MGAEEINWKEKCQRSDAHSCYRLLLLRFLPEGPAVVSEASTRAHSNLAVLMLRWESPTHPQTVPSLARGSIK